MFRGYGFFDYKYNIPGYAGQDFDGPARLIYIIGAFVLIALLLILFRKTKKEQVTRAMRFIGVFMVSIYLIKTTWESYFDITTGRGFNLGILPFDTCSLIMPACLIAGFSKGKAKKAAECWLSTGGIVGGIATIFFLQALKYYPFFTFGAFYSMLWHIVMVFVGCWLYVTGVVEANLKTVLYGFIFHLIFSLFVIPYDYIMDQDFMLYLGAGGMPFIEDLASIFKENHIRFLTTILVIHLYFAAFCFVTSLAFGLKKLLGLLFPKKEAETALEE